MAKFVSFIDGQFSGDLYVNIENVIEVRPDTQPNFSTILRLTDGRELKVAGKFPEVVQRLQSLLE